jgi:hypothetical protein
MFSESVASRRFLAVSDIVPADRRGENSARVDFFRQDRARAIAS